jgi:hypothetical protein
MRRNNIGSEPTEFNRRFSGTWSVNPWITSAILDPQGRRSGGSQAKAGAAAASDGECAAPPGSAAAAQAGTRDKQQLKAAVGAWEDEGGSTAAPAGTVGAAKQQ